MNTAHPPFSPAADEAASLWAARLDRGGLTPSEQQSLDRWLAADPAHRARLSEYCQMSADLEVTLPAIYPANAAPGAVHRALGQQRRQRAWWIGAGSLAAAFVLGGLFLFNRPDVQVIATSAAQRHMLTLADGTRANLNARTKVELSFARAERRVRLTEGEALFEVAKDAGRPFIVVTPFGDVTVTGTRFNVSLADAARLQVTVLEGSVNVRPAGLDTAHDLRPGDQLKVEARQTTILHLSPEGAADVAAWRDGTAVFEDAPLADACARFGRYHGREVRVAPAVASLRLGGRFSLDDFNGFMAGLEKVLPVRAAADDAGRWNVNPR
jgi:transmembrane sensor